MKKIYRFSHFVDLLFPAIILLLFCLFPTASYAVSAAVTEEGYRITSVPAAVGGGFDFLPNGDIVGLRSSLSFDALELVLIDANGDNDPPSTQVLHSIDGFLFGTFVKVSPSGNTVLFAESVNFNIYRYDVTSGQVALLTSVDGVFDAAFIDEENMYLSTGSFSGAGDVWYWNWVVNDVPKLIMSVATGSAAAGGITTDDVGTLYYISTTNVFPPPPNSHTLYRFTYEKILEVLDGTRPVLQLADGENTASMDTGYNIRVNAFADIFVSQTGSTGQLGVYRVKKDGTVTPFLSFNGLTGSEFLSILAFKGNHAFFDPFRQSTSRLAVLFDDFVEPTIYIVEPKPSDPFADVVVAHQLQSPFNNAELALAAPVGGGTFQANNTSIVSLTDGTGFIHAGFDGGIWDNRQGLYQKDLIVFGNAFFNSGNTQNRFTEPAYVEVKSDLNYNGNLDDDPWFLVLPNVLPSTLAAPYGPQALSNYADYSPTMRLGDTDGNNIVNGLDDPAALDPNLFYTIPDRPSLEGDSQSFEVDRGSGGGDAVDLRDAVFQTSPGVPFLDGEGQVKRVYLESVAQVRITDARTGDVCVGPCTAEIDAVSIAKNQIKGAVHIVESMNLVQSIIDSAGEGDVIRLKPGVYDLSAPILLKPGVSLEGMSGLWTVNFSGDDVVLNGSALSAGQAAIQIAGNPPTLEQDWSVAGLHFISCPIGISAEGLTFSIEENFFINCGVSVKLVGSGTGTVLVRKNIFGHVEGGGLTDAGLDVNGGSVAIVHNDFVHHQIAGVHYGSGAQIYLRDNIFVHNNIALKEEGTLSDAFGEFNVFFENILNSSGGAALKNDITSDPSFAQPAGGDYRLDIDSTVRGAGLGGSDPGVYEGSNFVPCDIAVLLDETAPQPPVDLTASFDAVQMKISLDWRNNSEPDLAGYNAYRAAVDQNNLNNLAYEKLNTGGLVTESVFIDETIQAGTNYFFYVTAVDTSGNESESSNVVEGGPNPPYVLDLPVFPIFNNGPAAQSGAYVAKMTLDFMGASHSVQELYDYAVAHNLSENSRLQSVDPNGLRSTLNQFDFPGYNFSVLQRSQQDDVLRDMAFWISRNIPNVPKPHVPGAIPAFGSYDRWFLVKGLVTTQNPHSGNDYEVLGFWFTDPNSSGIGANTFKTAEEIKSTYLLPIQNADRFQGRFLSVLEPPETAGGSQTIKEFESHLSSLSLWSSAAEGQYLAPLAYYATTVPPSLIIPVQDSARRAVEEDYLPYDEKFAEIFPRLEAQIPYYVESETGNYYLVPFAEVRSGFTGSVSAVVVLDNLDFHFKEISIGSASTQYLPVSKWEALRLLRNNVPLVQFLYRRLPVRFRLLRLGAENPYFPVWEIQIRNAVFHVHQDQRVQFISGPDYLNPKSRIGLWFNRILARRR
ncbi:MAG: hypothetical protein HY587_05740 [Candidatus Omnitrophica bacterium]|nr:hypothetical protein [Candidatus Omnitrophota bacterium]